ncbi:P-loop NTPase family protein [Marinobacter orientalis]|nr:polysaccharide biosynthesis protein [Marinobacter orientalis]
MTEQKQDREREEMEADTHPLDKNNGAVDFKARERSSDLQKHGSASDKERNSEFSHGEDSRMLVPSSLELGPGAVDRYVISKQIVKMQEPRRLTRDDMDERRIIYPESKNRELVNRFRHLRTKLLELSGGNNFTMVVSGACEGAGTSFMALNLAAAFAFDQSKTALIIDCNLRNPTLHSQLDLATETGLTDFLEDSDYDIGRIIYPTGIPRLRLIPAGSQRETPAEFFTSFRMKQFLQAVRRRYPDRFIVLDTAPIADSPDARILGELCDYSMLVLPHGKITATAAENAAQAFDPEKFVGAVING